MSTAMRRTLKAGLLALLVLLVAAPAAFAAPKWKIHATSNTNVGPGGNVDMYVVAQNVGDFPVLPANPRKLIVTLPAGMEGVKGKAAWFDEVCTPFAGASVIECEHSEFLPPWVTKGILFTAKADAGLTPGTLLTVKVKVEGGGIGPDESVRVIRVADGDPPFGIEGFDANAKDPSGHALTQAAGRPYGYDVEFAFNKRNSPQAPYGRNQPVEATKDILQDLPPGFLASAAGLPRCSLSQLTYVEENVPRPQCPEAAQVGILGITHGGRFDYLAIPDRLDANAIYNMQAPPGVAARFGVQIAKTVVVIDARVRSEGDYGVTVGSSDISGAVPLVGSSLRFWGVPADEAHRNERACVGSNVEANLTCPSTDPPRPFFRMPTSCRPESSQTTLNIDSWHRPGVFDSASVHSHEPLGFPYAPEDWGAPVELEGCAKVPFEPSLAVATTTNRADSPTGLTFDIGVPQSCWDATTTVAEAEEAICQSDLKDARVLLPAGLSVNPSAASGLASCSSQQIGLKTALGASPVHFSSAPQSCPDASKIGAVEIETPLVDHALKGDLFLAAQGDNPFKSLLGVYLVVEDFQTGVTVKLAGHLTTNEQTGQLEASFDENPQLPFSHLHVQLFGGPRAALRTPPACGTYTTHASLAPWSGNPAASLSSSFAITEACGSGFDPHLAAGTQNPLAGSFSPFHLRLSREDGTAELGGLRLALPPGLVASLKDIAYCPDSTLASISGALGAGAGQIASPSCPAASLVGTVTVGAGAGPTPFFTQTGRAYWAGPYKGAPVSLAVVVPAVAGPFDLGSVVVRNRFEVDPETAKITAISDPFPTSLYGIPLDLRDVRLDLDRPNYTLNPTGCDPLAFEGTLGSPSGQSAGRSVRFQAAACDRLRFKPKLSLRLKGKTNRGAHPALRAIVTMPPGGANLAKASVALPHSEFLDQGHIGTVCTRVQYAAGGGGGAQCPARSVYGHARAYSPILGYYLAGPVFLRSSSHELPDLVLSLHGPASQPIQVDAVGRIDSTKGGGIRSTFAAVPDVPVSKVVLDMRGGSKGLLQNSTNLCKGTHKATANLEAHNAKVLELAPELQADCGKAGKKKGKGAGSYRR